MRYGEIFLSFQCLLFFLAGFLAGGRNLVVSVCRLLMIWKAPFKANYLLYYYLGFRVSKKQYYEIQSKRKTKNEKANRPYKNLQGLRNVPRGVPRGYWGGGPGGVLGGYQEGTEQKGYQEGTGRVPRGHLDFFGGVSVRRLLLPY